MIEENEKTPTYSLVKLAVQPGDCIYVLNEDEIFEPVEVISVNRKTFTTKIGEIRFDEHGWLWRCLA